MPNDMTLAARRPPFTWGSEAMFVKLTEEGGMPRDAVELGFEYVLSIDDMQDLLAAIKGKKISRAAAAELVIHYALYDCAPAWFNDLPNI